MIDKKRFETYLLANIVISKSMRDRADKDLSKAKTQEQKSIFYVAGIRADERIKVYEELLRKLGE